MQSKENLAWAAGFMEGEGTFRFNQSGTKTQSLRIQVCQVARETLDRLVTILGCGKVYGPYGPYKGVRQKYHVYSVAGDCARDIMRVLLPMMSERRKSQISEALLKESTYKKRPR